MAFDLPDPKNIPIRPLLPGMHRNVPPELIPKGGSYTLENFYNTEQGIKRRPGLAAYAGGEQLSSPTQPLIDIVPFWTVAGDQVGCLLTSRYFYTLNSFAAPSPKYWTYSSGTIEASGVFVLGSSTTWSATGNILAGDVVIYDADGSGDGPESATVSSVNSDTEIAVTAAPTGTYAASTDYAIRRTFTVDDDYLLDSTVADGQVIVVDHTRVPYAFDGTDFGVYSSDIVYIPSCIEHHKERLYIGNVIEDSAPHPQRLRWSSATDRTSFAAADYYDLPYAPGEILRIITMGNVLVVFCEDAIYYGMPSNVRDLPVLFRRVETGGVGLIGPKAVTDLFDSLAFVGQDNIYLATNQGIKPIGNPIVENTIRQCDNLRKVYAAIDQKRDCVVFGFPDGSNEIINKIWRYNYKTKAWSYDLVDSTMIANPLLDTTLSWDDLSGILTTDTWEGFGTDFETWDDVGINSSYKDLFTANNGFIYYYSDNNSTDTGDEAITGMWVSPDYDFDMLDLDKTYLGFSMKLRTRPSADTLFSVEGSTDHGNTWEDFGNMTISADNREGRITFVKTGSTMRFRVTTSSVTEPFIVSEFVLRVRSRGREIEVD